MQWYGPSPPISGGRKFIAWGIGVVALAWAYVVSALLVRALPGVLPGQDFAVPGMIQLLEASGSERPGPEHPFNRPRTILVMGTDLRPGQDPLAVRTDTILVLRLDPATNKASALSIPRDLWVEIHRPDGNYFERVNTSYAAGALAGRSVAAGAAQLLADLEANFGITAEHFLWVDIAGAADVIDALGGIDVEIPEELTITDWYYTEDDVTNPQTLSFGAGKQHLSGYEAVAFSRYRNDSDLFRIQRQQIVVQAISKRLFSWSILRDPAELISAANDTIETDVPFGRLPGLALLANRAADDMALFSLGDDVDGVPTVYPFVTEGGAEVLDWDAANVAAIWAAAQATR
jgi:LCP family protein required for cell wall assembly